MRRFLLLVGLAVLLSSCVSVKWLNLVDEYDWPIHEALAVMECESAGEPGAHNESGSGAIGLMQIKWANLWTLAPFRPGGSGHYLYDSAVNTRAEKIAWLEDPENNVAAAYAIWLDGYGDSGWSRGEGERRSWSGKAKWACQP